MSAYGKRFKQVICFLVVVLLPSVSLGATSGGQDAQSANYAYNAAVAKDRFIDAQRCMEQTNSKLIAYHAEELCKSAGKGACQKAAGIANSTDLVGSTESACPIDDPEILERQFYTAVSNASTYGNEDAQVCYVKGGFRLDSVEDIAEYRRRATQYVANGFARGDWRVVYLVATPMEWVSHYAGALPNLSFIGKPKIVYRTTQLMMLGADESYRNELASRLVIAAGYLTDKEKAQGREWARKEFEERFTHSGVLKSDPKVCQ